jgi:hypothetical protein
MIVVDLQRRSGCSASDSTSDSPLDPYRPRFNIGFSLGFGLLFRALRRGKIREFTQPISKLLLLRFGACNLYIMEVIKLEMFSKSYCTINISYPSTQNSILKPLNQTSQV